MSKQMLSAATMQVIGAADRAMKSTDPAVKAETVGGLMMLHELIGNYITVLGGDDAAFCAGCGELIMDASDAQPDEEGVLCAKCAEAAKA